MVDYFKGKKVFVTGVGFIGTHLVNALIRRGAEVSTFKHLSDVPNLGFAGDLCGNPFWLERYLKRFQPEIVFHLAAQPLVGKDGFKSFEVNTRGCYHFYYACQDVDSIKCIFHVSTDKVYGCNDVVMQESPLVAFGEPYETSKLCGDAIAQMFSNYYGLPIIIARHANVYGPGDTHWDRLIPRTIKNLLEGKSPVVRGHNFTRDFLYITDVINGYLDTVERGDTTCAILGGDNYSVESVVNVLRDKINPDIPIVYEDAWRGEIPHQHIISNCIWAHRPLSEGLDLTIPWYRKMING